MLPILAHEIFKELFLNPIELSDSLFWLKVLGSALGVSTPDLCILKALKDEH